jgi:hypothetical protein
MCSFQLFIEGYVLQNKNVVIIILITSTKYQVILQKNIERRKYIFHPERALKKELAIGICVNM